MQDISSIYPCKVFCSASGQGYVYLTLSNEIFTINQSWFDSLDSKSREEEILAQLEKFLPEVCEIPEHFRWPLNGEELRHSIDKRLPSMILEITQQCSLRCEYCIYSGNYEGIRTHRAINMSWNTIKQSIDYFASHNEEYPTSDISFYGGEALLCFDSIRCAVEYARKRIMDKPLNFHISSNGTTLTPQIQEWLSENEDVSVAITLNGWSHDKYRKFSSGNGSLDCIMANLQQLQKNYPNVWERIDFLTNISSYREVLELREYYRRFIGKPPILISGIVKAGGNNTIKAITQKIPGDEQYIQSIRQLFIENYDQYIRPFYRLDIGDLCVRHIGKQTEAPAVPCCTPFAENFFVAADGTLAFCEKVNPTAKFGTIETGINFEKIEQVIEEALTAYNSKCRTCWARRLCDVCFQHMQKDKNGKLYIPDGACEDVKTNLLHNLTLFCDIKENNPSLLERIRADYAESYRKNHPEANQL